MQWKHIKKGKPIRVGNWRVKTRFAILPVRTTLPTDDTVIWLEFYQTNDRYEEYESFDAIGINKGWCIKQIAPRGYWNKDKK